MSVSTSHLPLQGVMVGFRRFTVAEYHHLIQTGFITENEPFELIEGYLVQKMGKNPPHECALDMALDLFPRIKPPGWRFRVQQAITLDDSESEPDLALARGGIKAYLHRHPHPADLGLVVEIADSSLAYDRADKTRIYGRAGIVCYWIVNLQERQIEVYTAPSGPTAAPGFARRQDFLPGAAVPFLLDGVLIASIPVVDLLP